jgi:hypothetical protein
MKVLTRVPMWVGPFHDAIDEIRRSPFSWKEHECAIGLAARVVMVLTGEDLAAEFRGRYEDAAGAYRVMREAGFCDLADLAASYLPEYAHPSEAQIGDIAALPVDTAFGHVLGVVNGDRIIVLGETILGTVDRSAARRAFRVG